MEPQSKFFHLLAPAFFFAAIFALTLSPASAIIDILPDNNPPGEGTEDGDGMDDVWQELFGAQAFLPGDDNDGDGKTNLEESIAGTNPKNPTDCLETKDTTLTATTGSTTIPTKRGKLYCIQVGDDLGNWTSDTTTVYGTGADLDLALSSTASTDLTGSISQQIWVDITGGAVSALTGDADFPDNPDGQHSLPRLESPENFDDNYGGRILGYIVPPTNDNYTFAISSRNQSELWLSTDDNPDNKVLVASVSNNSIQSGDDDEYSRFGSQQYTTTTPLVAGQKYYIEVLHKHSGQEDHCSVAWNDDGTEFSQLTVIDGDYLCPFTNVEASTTDEIVHYPLDEGTNSIAGDTALGNADPVGGVNDGTIVGGETWVTGVSGSALEFDGTDDQIDVPDSDDINTAVQDLRSVALWFKQDVNPTLSREIIYEEGGGTNGYSIYLDSGNLFVGFWVGGDSAYLSTAIGDTNWHHVAFVFDSNAGAGTFTGYLDGVAFGQAVDDGGVTQTIPQMASHGNAAAIGALASDTEFHDGNPVGTDFFFDGCVDEFRLWNRALSTAEIAGLAIAPAPLGGDRKFLRVTVKDMYTDGDGISDWAEFEMAGDDNFNPYDPDSTASTLGGGPIGDFDVIKAALTHPAGTPDTVTASVADGSAYEDPRNSNQLDDTPTPLANVPRNPARFRFRRTTLQPMTIDYTIGGDPLIMSDAAGNGTDYNEEDIDGNPISGSIIVPFGCVVCEVVVDPIVDAVYEYPEVVQCSVTDVDGPGMGAYDVSGGPVNVTIYDALDIPEQEVLLVGRSEPDPKANMATQGTALASGFLNGRRDHVRLNSLIMAGFSSPQNDSHIHWAQTPGPGVDGDAGGIVYEILNTPGEPLSNPKIGELLDYPWPIEDDNGNIDGRDLTGSRLIHALAGQDSPQTPGALAENPMYLNWHTNNNQGGELYAKFEIETGTIAEPDYNTLYPTPAALVPLAGAKLEREVRRFLNQATFGATDKSVYDMLALIASPPHNAAPVPRISAFNAWIDDQVDNISQTYLLDYTLAADNQEWKLRGYFDGSRWNVTPPTTLPTTWPGIDRTTYDSNPLVGDAINTMIRFPENQWVPTARFPVTQQNINDAEDAGNDVPFSLNDPVHSNRRRGHWALMLNGKDQLRQKMGYSLQQILVVADTLNRIRTHHLAAANYQDQLNYHAFNHFRDQFSWINWSPIMGKWLSSLKNQQAFDISDPLDGVPDVFPDENLAREDMQLFSIGLITLWLDGTLKLSEDTGLPEPTYLNTDITEFARVLTGQSFSRYTGSGTAAGAVTQEEQTEQWGITAADTGDPFDTDNNSGGGDDEDGNDGLLWNDDFDEGEGNKYYNTQFLYPMRMFGSFHDNVSTKKLAGNKTINQVGSNDDQRAVNDLDQAVTWFSGDPGNTSCFDMSTAHQSTPAFIAERLIQRFTKSNPSSGYLYRVANAFETGVVDGVPGAIVATPAGGGDLRATVKAILLDPEVRNLDLVDGIDGVDVNQNGDFTNPGDTPPDGDFADAGEQQPDLTTGLKKPPLDSYMQLIRNFSQRDTTGGGVFTEATFSQSPIADPALAGVAAIPANTEFPVTAPPADGYLDNFGYPATQAANFTMNCYFRYGDTDATLTMTPFSQGSVFNYYLPGFSPGGPVANAGLVSPELQIATETTTIQNVNYFRALDVGITGQGGNPLGGSPVGKNGNFNVRLLYGLDGDAGGTLPDGSDPDDYENVRIALIDWAENIINWAAIGTGTGSQDAFDDIVELVDAVDQRLLDGRFKAKYPLDPGVFDDTDTANELDTSVAGRDLDQDGMVEVYPGGHAMAGSPIPDNDLDINGDGIVPDNDGINPSRTTTEDANISNDKELRNPREIIIRALFDMSYNPYVSNATTRANNQRNLLRYTLELLTGTPEFNVHK